MLINIMLIKKMYYDQTVFLFVCVLAKTCYPKKKGYLIASFLKKFIKRSPTT